MKKRFLVLLFAVFSLAFFSACNYNNRIKRLQELEEGVSSPATEAELKEAIKKYERRVDDIIIAEGRVGVWYKMLGSRYMYKKIYKKALECFKASL